MRAASRLLAAVKPGKFLEPNTPTGLTGLNTHPSPRSTLIYLYQSTLDKLQHIPETSVYRQSTEALTKHRLAIIEAAVPTGLKEWQEKIQYQVGENRGAFDVAVTSKGMKVRQGKTKKDIHPKTAAAEWNGEVGQPNKEGIRTSGERARMYARMAGGPGYNPEWDFKEVILEPEPPLTAEQISEVESQIGAGLIEEVIQVAEGENKLAEEMVNSRVWEDLTEPAPEGQWTYFERGTHTSTQKP